MVELELLGIHGDGEHLSLTDPDGRRYLLPIDDTLRAAVRRDRPRLEALQAAGESALRPKDIQSLIRAGASVTEVAEMSGLPVEHVRRYEGPVLAERAWVVQQAQAQRIGHDGDAPRLGDLVVDRLAARGVAVQSLDWDAVRRPGGPWEVLVTFVAADREREARWEMDLAARTLHAVDDEARWLSETEVGPGFAPRRHLSTVGAGRAPFDVEAAGSHPADGPPPATDGAGADGAAGTDVLLAELAAHRGTRVPPEPEEDDGDPWSIPGAHPPASRPEEAVDAHVLALPRRGSTRAGAEPEPGTTPALPAREAGATAGPAEPGTTPALPGGPAPAAGDPADLIERGTTPALPAPSDAASTGPTTGADERPAGGPPSSAAAQGPSGRPGADQAAPRREAGAARSGRRNARRSVPSWDEIVFGAKPE